jgi:hypothetical protein
MRKGKTAEFGNTFLETQLFTLVESGIGVAIDTCASFEALIRPLKYSAVSGSVQKMKQPFMPRVISVR